MIFQYGSESVLIQRILISVEAKLEINLRLKFLCSHVQGRSWAGHMQTQASAVSSGSTLFLDILYFGAGTVGEPVEPVLLPVMDATRTCNKHYSFKCDINRFLSRSL